jgi:hypothetical protein
MFFFKKNINVKKGEVGQVFIYILTILIMGLMLYFGIKWIMGLILIQDEIAVTQLKIDLEDSFNNIRSQTRSSENMVFNVPSGLKKVCFLDRTYPYLKKQETDLCTLGKDDYNPLMCNAWTSNDVDESIFFDPPVSVAIYVKDIKVDPTEHGYKCIAIDNNKFKVKLIGLGIYVRVSSVP